MLQIIRQFRWLDGVFSLKTFVAAMLALYIAFRLDLSQPSWSVTTVYIVSQPFAGMVLAKSLYRVLGTLIGAVMSLLMVALFSNAPELFCLALAIWIGLGTFITIYLRDAPQAYVGMLSGYSAAIIGLPAALAPDTAFDFAVARCLEITLGIACATLIHHVVFPQRAGDALRRALDAMLPRMARWVGDALQGRQSEARGLVDRRDIIASAVALDGLRVFAAIDTPAIRAVDPVIRRFEGTLLSLLALLVSVYDRFALLRRDRPAAAEALQPLMTRAADHIAASAGATTPDDARREGELEAALKLEIDRLLPSREMLGRDPRAFLLRSILLRLGDILEMWRDAVWLRTHITSGLRLDDGQPAPGFHPYRDTTLAVVGGLVSMVTVLIASAFWIGSAWSSGPTAITYAGIMCAIMGGRDNPAAASTMFLKMSIVGSLIAWLYLFAVLPPLTTYPVLVVALAPFYLLCGLLLTSPVATPFTMPLIFVAGGLIGISNTMAYDFAAFGNNVVSYVVGIGIGAAALGLLRPIGADWAVRRLCRGMFGDLAHAAGSAVADTRQAFESRMFDRINALFMRLDPMVAEPRAILQASLAALRIGLNILALRNLRLVLPAAAVSSVQQALAALAGHFERMRRGRASPLPLAVLVTARQAMLAAGEQTELVRAAEALYNIETTLRLHADFFAPAAPMTPMTSSDTPTDPVTA
ncbi:FUSC family protein [Bradyrhizobium prioriisuperbiae]|uniref:FUSC family protein n=1 Tax=Bradyrhizobium prioriisuperbiae TaxID=2854389 RepID=UPI0028E6CC7B|nr:FUSC family protein [Bradyrhizobium prioritasuperba]